MTLNSLRTLPDGLADLVGRHLAAAARALGEDPELSLSHAKAASRRAGRVALVREAVGIAAYAAGDFGTALIELRAAARISGSAEYLPMMADCERGLGRPEKALALVASPQAETLDRDARVELLIVAAGARRDLGQVDAAVLTLQVPALRAAATGSWLARLRYAYADALLEAGRSQEAREWFELAARVDPEGETDADERVDELDGLVFDEVAEDEGEVEEAGAGEETGRVPAARGAAPSPALDVVKVEFSDAGQGDSDSTDSDSADADSDAELRDAGSGDSDDNAVGSADPDDSDSDSGSGDRGEIPAGESDVDGRA